MTAYVTRDGQGNVVSVHAGPTSETEAIADDDAALAAYRAAEPVVVSYAEFRARFTAAELAGVRVAVLADAEAMDWALDAAADNSVNLRSRTTSDFLDKMIAAGIIDAGRKAEIVS